MEQPIVINTPLPLKIADTVGSENLFKGIYLIEKTGKNLLQKSPTYLNLHPSLWNSGQNQIVLSEHLIHSCAVEDEVFTAQQVYEVHDFEDELKMIAPRMRCTACDSVYKNPSDLCEGFFIVDDGKMKELTPSKASELEWLCVGNNNTFLSEFLTETLFSMPELTDYFVSENYIDTIMSEKHSEQFMKYLVPLGYVQKIQGDFMPITHSHKVNAYRLTQEGYERLEILEKEAHKIGIANLAKSFVKERARKIENCVLENKLQEGYIKNSIIFKGNEYEKEKIPLIHFVQPDMEKSWKYDKEFYWTKKPLANKAESRPLTWDEIDKISF